MPIRILLADDHAIVRQGLANLLNAEQDMQVIGEAHSGKEALELIESLRPDLIVLDIAMPDMNGLKVLQSLAGRAQRPAVVILTMYDKVAYVVEALNHPRCSFVLKEETSNGLVEAIRITMRGGRYISPAILPDQISRYQKLVEEHELNLPDTLTNRERQVLELIVSGKSNLEIAMQFSISRRTVEKHREHLMRKLHVQNQVDLMRYAFLRGLTDLGDNQ